MARAIKKKQEKTLQDLVKEAIARELSDPDYIQDLVSDENWAETIMRGLVDREIEKLADTNIGMLIHRKVEEQINSADFKASLQKLLDRRLKDLVYEGETVTQEVEQSIKQLLPIVIPHALETDVVRASLLLSVKDSIVRYIEGEDNYDGEAFSEAINNNMYTYLPDYVRQALANFMQDAEQRKAVGTRVSDALIRTLEDDNTEYLQTEIERQLPSILPDIVKDVLTGLV